MASVRKREHSAISATQCLDYHNAQSVVKRSAWEPIVACSTLAKMLLVRFTAVQESTQLETLANSTCKVVRKNKLNYRSSTPHKELFGLEVLSEAYFRDYYSENPITASTYPCPLTLFVSPSYGTSLPVVRMAMAAFFTLF